MPDSEIMLDTDTIFQQAFDSLDLHELRWVIANAENSSQSNKYFWILSNAFCQAYSTLKNAIDQYTANADNTELDQTHQHLWECLRIVILFKNLYNDFDKFSQNSFDPQHPENFLDIKIDLRADGQILLFPKELNTLLNIGNNDQQIIECFGADKLLAYLSNYTDQPVYKKFTQRHKHQGNITQDTIHTNTIRQFITRNTSYSNTLQLINYIKANITDLKSLITQKIKNNLNIISYFIRLNWQSNQFVEAYWLLYEGLNIPSLKSELIKQADYLSLLGLTNTILPAYLLDLPPTNSIPQMIEAAIDRHQWFLTEDLLALIDHVLHQLTETEQASIHSYQQTGLLALKMVQKDSLTVKTLTTILNQHPSWIPEHTPNHALTSHWDTLQKPFYQTFENKQEAIPDNFRKALLFYLILTGKTDDPEFNDFDFTQLLPSNQFDEDCLDLCFQYTQIYKLTKERSYLPFSYSHYQQEITPSHQLIELVGQNLEYLTNNYHLILNKAILHGHSTFVVVTFLKVNEPSDYPNLLTIDDHQSISRSYKLQLVNNWIKLAQFLRSLNRFPIPYSTLTEELRKELTNFVLFNQHAIFWRDILNQFSQIHTNNLLRTRYQFPMYIEDSKVDSMLLAILENKEDIQETVSRHSFYSYLADKAVEHDNQKLLIEEIFFRLRAFHFEPNIIELRAFHFEPNIIKSLFAKAIQHRNINLIQKLYECTNCQVPLADFIYASPNLYDAYKQPLLEQSDLDWFKSNALPRIAHNIHTLLTIYKWYQPSFFSSDIPHPSNSHSIELWANNLIMFAVNNIFDNIVQGNITLTANNKNNKNNSFIDKLNLFLNQLNSNFKDYLRNQNSYIKLTINYKKLNYLLYRLVYDFALFHDNAYKSNPINLTILNHYHQQPKLNFADIVETVMPNCNQPGNIPEETVRQQLEEHIAHELHQPSFDSTHHIARYILMYQKLSSDIEPAISLIRNKLNQLAEALTKPQQDYSDLFKHIVLLQDLRTYFTDELNHIPLVLKLDSNNSLCFRSDLVNEQYSIKSSYDTLTLLIKQGFFDYFYRHSSVLRSYLSDNITQLAEVLFDQIHYPDNERTATNGIHLAIESYNAEVFNALIVSQQQLKDSYKDHQRFDKHQNHGLFLLNALKHNAHKQWQRLRQHHHCLPSITTPLYSNSSQSFATEMDHALDNTSTADTEPLKALLDYAWQNNKTALLPYLFEELDQHEYPAAFAVAIKCAAQDELLKQKLYQLIDNNYISFLKQVLNHAFANAHTESDYLDRQGLSFDLVNHVLTLTDDSQNILYTCLEQAINQSSQSIIQLINHYLYNRNETINADSLFEQAVKQSDQGTTYQLLTHAAQFRLSIMPYLVSSQSSPDNWLKDLFYDTLLTELYPWLEDQHQLFIARDHTSTNEDILLSLATSYVQSFTRTGLVTEHSIKKAQNAITKAQSQNHNSLIIFWDELIDELAQFHKTYEIFPVSLQQLILLKPQYANTTAHNVDTSTTNHKAAASSNDPNSDAQQQSLSAKLSQLPPANTITAHQIHDYIEQGSQRRDQAFIKQLLSYHITDLSSYLGYDNFDTIHPDQQWLSQFLTNNILDQFQTSKPYRTLTDKQSRQLSDSQKLILLAQKYLVQKNWVTGPSINLKSAKQSVDALVDNNNSYTLSLGNTFKSLLTSIYHSVNRFKYWPTTLAEVHRNCAALNSTSLAEEAITVETTNNPLNTWQTNGDAPDNCYSINASQRQP